MTKNILPELSFVNFGSYLQFFHPTYHIINIADHAVNLTVNCFHFVHILAVLFLRFKSFHFGNEFPEDVKFFCSLVKKHPLLKLGKQEKNIIVPY